MQFGPGKKLCSRCALLCWSSPFRCIKTYQSYHHSLNELVLLEISFTLSSGLCHLTFACSKITRQENPPLLQKSLGIILKLWTFKEIISYVTPHRHKLNRKLLWNWWMFRSPGETWNPHNSGWYHWCCIFSDPRHRVWRRIARLQTQGNKAQRCLHMQASRYPIISGRMHRRGTCKRRICNTGRPEGTVYIQQSNTLSKQLLTQLQRVFSFNRNRSRN